MSAPTPIATAAELGRILGIGDEVDTDQADFVIEQITILALGVVDPLPAGAKPVILRVAAFSYGNPTGATGDISGDRTMQWGQRIPFDLSRKDKRDLRRAAGVTTGAFTVNVESEDAGTTILAHDRDEGYVSPDAPDSSKDSFDTTQTVLDLR